MSIPTPSLDLVRHESCPVCHGPAVRYLEGTHDLHYGIDGSWTYQRCTDCRVVFLNPAPTPQFLAASYNDDYYSYQQFTLPPRWETWLRTLIGYKIDRTGDPVFTSPGRVLDIGCGSGEFLYKMKQSGWETHGVELSAKAADIGNKLHGLNIHAGTVHTAEFAAGYFDYIRLNHSFEHLLDPRETLDRIRGFLAPHGLVFIGVPNVDSILARLFGRYWWNLGPPVHPFNYSKTTLTRLLGEHGFEVIVFRTNSNFAGILGSMQMALNDRRGVRADTGWLLRNLPAKILTHWLAKTTDLFAAGDCLEIVARRRNP